MDKTIQTIEIPLDMYVQFKIAERDFGFVKKVMARTKSNYLDDADYQMLKILCGIEDEKGGAEK